MASKSSLNTGEIVISEVQRRVARFCIIGRSPLILNRLSEKAKHELLLPRGKKSAAEKAISLKHNPFEEYRASPYLTREGDTALALPSVAFKKAAATAALDMPGAKKSQILRLLYMPDMMVNIYGVPRIFCAVTRSADMNKTPDVRTRCIVPQWAAVLTVEFAYPQLNEASLANLINAAGFICGVGDWRQEKGSGNYGSFRLTSPDDAEFRRIVETGKREAQLEALESPVPYDAETAELLGWFESELSRRGHADLLAADESDEEAEAEAVE